MTTEHTITLADQAVSALLDVPDHPWGLAVLAHGAGAGMRHRFFEALTPRLVARGLGVLRYQFPYMETGRKRPDPPAVAQATVRAAVEAARRLVPEIPLFAGGKSFGGRMTSQAQADAPLPGVRGIVFLGFPLHRPGAPGTARADHLSRVAIPMLFVQGTRDTLADLGLIESVVTGLGDRARLHVVDGGDHSFGVLKRSGRTHEAVLDEIADGLLAWGRPLAGG